MSGDVSPRRYFVCLPFLYDVRLYKFHGYPASSFRNREKTNNFPGVVPPGGHFFCTYHLFLWLAIREKRAAVYTLDTPMPNFRNRKSLKNFPRLSLQDFTTFPVTLLGWTGWGGRTDLAICVCVQGEAQSKVHTERFLSRAEILLLEMLEYRAVSLFSLFWVLCATCIKWRLIGVIVSVLMFQSGIRNGRYETLSYPRLIIESWNGV